MRYPDLPQEIDMSYLERMDREPPGTYCAQSKLDGQRFTEEWKDGEWTFAAKNNPAKWPDDLTEEWVEFWRPVTSRFWQLRTDSEWTGPRQGKPSIVWLFDLLSYKDKWLGDTPFPDRYSCLARMYFKLMGNKPLGRIRLLPVFTNPGLVDLFHQQLVNPLSEGIVIRRHDSGLVGGLNHPVVNPMWMKAKFETVNRVLNYQGGQ